MRYRDLTGNWQDFFKARWPARLAIPLARLHRELVTALEDQVRAKETALAPHVVCDEDGKPKVDDKGMVSILQGHEAEARQIVAEIDNAEIQVNKIKLKATDIPEEITPLLLSMFLDFLEVEE